MRLIAICDIGARELPADRHPHISGTDAMLAVGLLVERCAGALDAGDSGS
jgi:hypothetical protein